MKNGLIEDQNNITRCWWPGSDDQYIRYHDEEWGYPIVEDRHLFEKLCLEGFQSGLSWLTILRKRDNFRAAFANFEIKQVAAFNEEDVDRLLQDAGIVRHGGKINAVINNASRALEMQKEFGSLAAYFWSYEPKDHPVITSKDQIVSTTKESIAMSKDLKKRGWKFVGPTTAYAFMQSMGIVNDHIQGCCCFEKSEQLRAEFKRPTVA